MRFESLSFGRAAGVVVRALSLGCGLGVAASCAVEGGNPGDAGAGGAGGRAGSGGNGNDFGGDAGGGEPGCGTEQEGEAVCAEDGTLSLCKSGGFVELDRCGANGRCSAARRACLDCAPGSFRCSGPRLEQCNLEGSGFEVVRTCASDAACRADEGSGYCVICEPERPECEALELEFATSIATTGASTRPNGSLRACNATGSGTRAIELCDVRMPVCSTDPALCLECRPGESACLGSELFRCADDGLSFTLVEDCGHAARCDADAAECLPSGCAGAAGARADVGTVACRGTNGTELSICGASGQWEILDLCDSGEACNFGVTPRRCLDAADGFCIPGSSSCVGRALQRCAEFREPGTPHLSGGRWYVFGNCTGQCVTSSATSAECAAGAGPLYTDVSACEPGASTFLDCSGAACVSASCSAEEVCAGAASGCNACVPEKFRCEGDLLKRCNTTGTAEATVEDCGDGVCDEFRGACLPARPGERVCVEGELRRVAVDGTVQSIADCGSQALCDPGAGCRPARCVVGSVICGGGARDRVLRCDDGLGFADTGTRCDSAARCENGLGCARASRLAAGDAHTCTLIVAADAGDDAAGYVKCWGANDGGQLGNGSALLGDEPEARSVVTETASGVFSAVPRFRPTGLCAGRSFTCADAELANGDGVVVCWGANERGQLGIGGAPGGNAPLRGPFNHVVAPVTDGTDAAPRDGVPDPLIGLHAVTCGADFACALDAGGRAWCWGAHDAGQVGNGQAVRASVPEAALVAGSQGFTSLIAGARHVCALDRIGTTWCWGDGEKGQLGRPDSSPVARPIALGSLLADALALGRDFTLLRVPGRPTLLAFGQNFFGQLATGTSQPSNLPVATLGLGTDDVGAVFGGEGAAHACALVRGSLACWGANPLGQLGDGTNVDRYVPSMALARTDTRLSGGEGSVALGKSHTCAIDADGGIWCWGGNRRGQLGAGVSEIAALSPRSVY